MLVLQVRQVLYVVMVRYGAFCTFFVSLFFCYFLYHTPVYMVVF